MQGVVPQALLGRFKLIAPLGKGGMGEVWKAQDVRLSRDVAIKILPPDLANFDLRVRFERESKILAAMNHPNIAQIYEAGEDVPQIPGSSIAQDKISYLVMELIDGKSLSQILSSGPLPVLTAVRMGRQMARALGAAHKAGIIHRDLKPANIMVAARNQIKILDFGLARPQPGLGAGAPTLPEVTASGMVMGTAAYLSPEQVKGEPADVRSDIWALGCVYYQMLAGERPFPGDSIPEIFVAVLRDDPVKLSVANPGAPAALIALVDKCLAKNPNDRPQSAFEIGAALKDIFHQLRQTGQALVSSESISGVDVAVNIRSIENVNRFLKMINASYPQLPIKNDGPAAVELNHRGIKIGIVVATKEKSGADIVAFVTPLFKIPVGGKTQLFKKLLALSNGHTGVGQFAVDRDQKIINLVCIRASDSLEPGQFQITLDTISEAASALAPGLKKELGIQ